MRAAMLISITILLAAWRAAAGFWDNRDSNHNIVSPVINPPAQPAGTAAVSQNITLYIAKPDPKSARAKERAGTAVLYLSDVFGLASPENLLLADSYARAGYLVVAPDLFNGTPAPSDFDDPSFNMTEFLNEHLPAVIDPIIARTIKYLHKNLGVARIAAAGYCFGGRYVFRFLAAGRGVDVGYAAHPAMLEANEVAAITGPVSIAAGDRDVIFNARARQQTEALLAAGKQPYQVFLYSGVPHGFAVRANLSDPLQRFAKEEAFAQAVKWFDHFLANG